MGATGGLIPKQESNVDLYMNSEKKPNMQIGYSNNAKNSKIIYSCICSFTVFADIFRDSPDIPVSISCWIPRIPYLERLTNMP